MISEGQNDSLPQKICAFCFVLLFADFLITSMLLIDFFAAMK